MAGYFYFRVFKTNTLTSNFKVQYIRIGCLANIMNMNLTILIKHNVKQPKIKFGLIFKF